MANKVTKKENFLKLKSMVDDVDLIAFIDNEIALLDKKNSAKKGPTKTQKENEGIKDTILNAMEPGASYSVGEIMALIGSGYTNQKVSALLSQLVDNGSVKRTLDKRKAYFSLV